MKAAVLKGVKSIETIEKNISELGKKDVLVKVMSCGVCGTDVHIYHGEEGSADVTYPIVLGHEFSGLVVDVGSGVTNCTIGDKVTIDPNIYCGECEYCRTGRKQLCNHMKAIGVTRDGGFEQLCRVPASQVIKIADHLSFEKAAFAEPLACCIHGLDIVNVSLGDQVVVIGGGAIGLLMVQLAKLAGASRVILSEPVELRRKIGLKVGADFALDPRASDLKTQINQIVSGRSIDVIIECVGKEVAVKQAIGIADKGSRILLFGVPHVDAKVNVPLFDIFKKELKIYGSFVNPDTQLRAVELLNSGRLHINELITHRYGIDEVGEAIAMQMGNESIKVLVNPNS